MPAAAANHFTRPRAMRCYCAIGIGIGISPPTPTYHMVHTITLWTAAPPKQLCSISILVSVCQVHAILSNPMFHQDGSSMHSFVTRRLSTPSHCSRQATLLSHTFREGRLCRCPICCRYAACGHFPKANADGQTHLVVTDCLSSARPPMGKKMRGDMPSCIQFTL